MSNRYHDLATVLPSEHHRVVKILRQLPKSASAKPAIKHTVRCKELVPCTFSAPVQETVNLIIYNMIQLLREEAVGKNM